MVLHWEQHLLCYLYLLFILRYLILQYSRKIYSSYSFGIGNSWNFNLNRADKEGRYERAG